MEADDDRAIQIPSQQSADPNTRLPTRYAPATGTEARTAPTRIDAEIGTGKVRARMPAAANKVHPRPNSTKLVMPPRNRRPPAPVSKTTGATSASHGTANASYHQSP